MTEEQVELELAHWELDKKLREGKHEEYEDPEYEEYDKETDEIDDKSSYGYVPDEVVNTSEEVRDRGIQEGEWEDVEIDDPDLPSGSEVYDPEYD